MKQQIKKLLLCLAMFFSVVIAFAQERQVSGTVKDTQGKPLSNASYLIKGTKTGGVTDENGHFSIDVKSPKTILVFSSVDFLPKEVTVGQNSQLNVVLENSNNSMKEVVVTALGIKRAPRSIGYTVQQVGGAELARSNAPNVADALAGKVASLNITTPNGVEGGSTSMDKEIECDRQRNLHCHDHHKGSIPSLLKQHR